MTSGTNGQRTQFKDIFSPYCLIPAHLQVTIIFVGLSYFFLPAMYEPLVSREEYALTAADVLRRHGRKTLHVVNTRGVVAETVQAYYG